jgi:hypothetical protein
MDRKPALKGKAPAAEQHLSNPPTTWWPKGYEMVRYPTTRNPMPNGRRPPLEWSGGRRSRADAASDQTKIVDARVEGFAPGIPIQGHSCPHEKSLQKLKTRCARRRNGPRETR